MATFPVMRACRCSAQLGGNIILQSCSKSLQLHRSGTAYAVHGRRQHASYLSIEQGAFGGALPSLVALALRANGCCSQSAHLLAAQDAAQHAENNALEGRPPSWLLLGGLLTCQHAFEPGWNGLAVEVDELTRDATRLHQAGMRETAVSPWTGRRLFSGGPKLGQPKACCLGKSEIGAGDTLAIEADCVLQSCVLRPIARRSEDRTQQLAYASLLN